MQPPTELLQPLPIPTMVWDHITMNFITALPQSCGYSVIMVAVDKLMKYSHFGALLDHFNAPKVAQVFVAIVVKLNGFLNSIVSDRDPIFMTNFWLELFTLSGTTLKCSTTYYPRTDEQIEVINRGVEQYL